MTRAQQSSAASVAPEGLARLLDGKALAATVRSETAKRVAALANRGVQPGLAVVLVGSDPASQVYVRNKTMACEKTGIRSMQIDLPANVSASELLRRIADLNSDPRVHGILVQLPLPPHIDPHKVQAAIAPEMDVDAFHPENLGTLLAGRARFLPCTPAGIMRLIDHAEIPIGGRQAVVIGRSNIVGKPMAILLLQRDATVTICHSKTPDIATHVREADIVIAAVGRPRMVRADMIKPGACVIDVGINRLPDGRLAGDVDYDEVQKVAGWLTPVPGGVGPMTIAMLLANCVQAAEVAV